MSYNPFQLTWNISAKEEIVTTQMLLNSKCMDKLVLHNGVWLIQVSLFACNVPSELKRIVAVIPGMKFSRFYYFCIFSALVLGAVPRSCPHVLFFKAGGGGGGGMENLGDT